MVNVIVQQEGVEEEGKVYIGKTHLAIQKAINYVYVNGGGSVFIDKGVYNINNTSNNGITIRQDTIGSYGITLYPNIELFGENDTLLKANFSKKDSEITSVLTLNGSQNNYIHDLCFSGGDGNILCYKSKNIKIENCGLLGFNNFGINFIDTESSFILDNTLLLGKQNGIELHGSNLNNIMGNTINGMAKYGMYLIESCNNVINENSEDDNTDDGIYLNTNNHNNIIKNNVINDGKSCGIHLNVSNDNVVIANICRNNVNGIQIGSSSNNMVTDNLINGNTGNGIYLNVTQNSDIINNVIINNKGCGIEVYKSDINSIYGNNLYGNKYSIYSEKESKKLLMYGNVSDPDNMNGICVTTTCSTYNVFGNLSRVESYGKISNCKYNRR